MNTSQKIDSALSGLLAGEYGIESASIEKLVGYDCENYTVTSSEGKFVLKVYPEGSATREFLEAETEVLRLVNSLQCVEAPVARDGQSGPVTVDENGRLARLLSFVDGKFLDELEPEFSLFESLGKMIAAIDHGLMNVRVAAVEARRLDWDLQHYRLNLSYLEFIESPQKRKLIEYFFLQAADVVDPKVDGLRRTIIHGDAHLSNVLAKDGRVSGFIDFSDISYSPLINDLAVSLTYVLFLKKNGLALAKAVVEGYASVLPLSEEEIELLYYLIGIRAAVSVCHSAEAKTRKPNDPYITVSEKDAWDLLHRLTETNPLWLEDHFRQAAGFETKLLDSTDADVARRNKHTSRALSVTFSKPVKMERAAFQYMFDSLGNSYLDCYNNIPQVGHCHPRVVEAGRRAMARLNTNARYLNDTFNYYSENLIARFPRRLNKVFFVNSGSAATDLALRLAMTHTGKRGVLVMEHGYHGNTRLGIDVSHYKYNRKGGTGRVDGIVEAPIPDTYKGTHQDHDAGARYANEALERVAGAEIAAFLAEPVIGCGGQVPLAQGYLKTMYPGIRQMGGVCISDEVQTGFGRLGKYFWGFEMHGVEPDIVILGKPMGNGHPVAAVVTTDEIAKSFETGMEFFSSFGGNPVSMAIAQAVLDVLDEEELPENADAVGGYLLNCLKDIVGNYESAGDARGVGLFLGFELIKNGDPNAPNTGLATLVKDRLREDGILIGSDGPFENVIKIKPPLCFTKENADRLADEIESIIGEEENK